MAKRPFLPPGITGEVVPAITLTPETGVDAAQSMHWPAKLVLTLDAVQVPIAAADDFGSALLATFPETNLLITATVADLTFEVAGLTSDVATTVDMAIGTVATASADFSNAGEDDLMPKFDGVGAGATGSLQGAASSSTVNVYLEAAADNEVYLNVASPVATGEGTITVSGTITLFVLDLGAAA